jgi:hypothetical protein
MYSRAGRKNNRQQIAIPVSFDDPVYAP